MKIQIRQPLAFSEIGLKDNQEDTLYPKPDTVTIEQRVFLMCDGMGGHEHGEVASNVVAKTIGETLEALSGCEDCRVAFEAALSRAYDALDAADMDESGKKMGTTMTCLWLTPSGALMTHIGDSRIYQVRPSGFDAETGRNCIKNVTSDHSLVNDLLKAGELTEEEALNYPHKNIITRAMQPNQERRSKADVNLEWDVREGDYFFMCCDGVLEQLTDRRLCEILADKTLDDKAKLAAIKAECENKTKDNYTCWLIPIDRVTGDPSDQAVAEDEQVITADAVGEDECEPDKPSQESPVERKQTSNSRYKVMIAAILLALVAGAAWYAKSHGLLDSKISEEVNPIEKFGISSQKELVKDTANVSQDTVHSEPKEKVSDLDK